MKEKKHVVDFIGTETPGSLYELQKIQTNLLWEDNSLGFNNKHNTNIYYIKIGELVLYLGSTETNRVNFLLPNGTVGNISTYMLGRIAFYGLGLIKVNGDNNAQI